MRVTVEEYNPQWAIQFQKIKQDLETILQGVDYISIEHVGSTSVPGLAAKPVLDIDVVATQEQLESIKTALTDKGGYQYLGEWGIPHRHVFRRSDAIPTRNLYVCIQGSQSLRNHLLVRDICRQDPAIRGAYGRKKLELSQQDWPSVNEYCEAKNEILLYILEAAGLDRDELAEIRQRNTAATRS